MAKKNGKISVNEFEKAIKSFYEAQTEVEWHGINIIVRRNLGIGDISFLVNSVADACFDNETGAYTPWAKDAALRLGTLAFYTNISVPSNAEAAYLDAVCSGIVEDVVFPNIDMRQYGSICEAIDRGIRYRASVHEEAVERKLEALCNAMNELCEQFQSSMEGISKEDVASLVDVLSRAAED